MTRTAFAVALVASMLVSSAAFAGAPISESPVEPSNAPAPSSVSPGLAAGLAVGATVAPVVLGSTLMMSGADRTGLAVLVSGIAIGPSAGYYYAGLNERATQGVMLRTVVAGVAWLDVVSLLGDDPHDDDARVPILYASLGALSALVVADWILTPVDVTKARRAVGVSITPRIDYRAGGMTAGVAVRF